MMLSDYSLNHNTELRTLVLSHPKGYVGASILVKDQFIDQILSEAGVKDPSRQ